MIECDVEGATILVDGEDRGRTPRRDPIRVAPGVHHLELMVDGNRIDGLGHYTVVWQQPDAGENLLRAWQFRTMIATDDAE